MHITQRCDADDAIDWTHDVVRLFDDSDAESKRRVLERFSPPSIARLMRYYDAVDKDATATRSDTEYIECVGERWKRDMIAHARSRVDDSNCEWDTMRALCSRPWQRASIARAVEAMVAINGEDEIRRVFERRLTIMHIVIDVTGYGRPDFTLTRLFHLGATAYAEDETKRRTLRALYGTDVRLTNDRPSVNVVIF